MPHVSLDWAYPGSCCGPFTKLPFRFSSVVCRLVIVPAPRQGMARFASRCDRVSIESSYSGRGVRACSSDVDHQFVGICAEL
jgi:hypothetical protein